MLMIHTQKCFFIFFCGDKINFLQKNNNLKLKGKYEKNYSMNIYYFI